MLRAGAPGVVVGVRDSRGAAVPRYAFRAGVADRRTRRPARRRPRFRIGSVSKTFLATVVLQLAQEHRLAIGVPIAR